MLPENSYLCGVNYKQYSDHIKLCHYLGKEPQGEFKEFHDFLTGLWKDMEFTVIDDNNEQGIIFHKGTDFYMEQDFKNKQFWYQRKPVYSFFRDEKDMNHTDILNFIMSVVEQHLKCITLTPRCAPYYAPPLVEKHLKYINTHPSVISGVEKYFIKTQYGRE
jgi:hypothetical protein